MEKIKIVLALAGASVQGQVTSRVISQVTDPADTQNVAAVTSQVAAPITPQDATPPTMLVAVSFAEAQQFVLVESDTGHILASLARQGRTDTELARQIADWGCECLLCGPLEEAAFLIIADEAGVTRYNAASLTFAEAIKRFNAGSLELIRDCVGGFGCQNH